jgi:rRNA processing protein Gar1
LGPVVAISSQGHWVVRTDRDCREGVRVRDAEGRYRGRILRVFGPVSRPYVAVAPDRPLDASEAVALLGKVLNITEASDRGE